MNGSAACSLLIGYLRDVGFAPGGERSSMEREALTEHEALQQLIRAALEYCLGAQHAHA